MLTCPDKITARALGKWSHFKSDVVRAKAFAEQNGCKLYLTDAAYQVAKIIGEDVKLVIYPHRLGSGGRSLRIRNEGSANRAKADGLMHASGFGIHNG